MPAQAAAGIGVGGSLFGGWLASRGAKSAGKTLQESGEAANRALIEELTANKRWVAGSTEAAQRGQAEATRATQEGMAAATQAAQGRVEGAGTEANQTLADVWGGQREHLDPYLEAGRQGVTSLADLFKPGGALTEKFRAPTGEEVEATPGYQFQLQQGQKALQRSAAGRGLLGSGATLKALDKYSQDVASTNYEKAYNRAFNEFQTNRTNTLGGAMALTGVGRDALSEYNRGAMNFGNLSSANTTGTGALSANFGMRGQEYIGNAGMRGQEYIGNAGMRGAEFNAAQGNQMTLQAIRAYLDGQAGRAAGQQGSANAWGNAIRGVAGAAGGYFAQRPPSGNPWLQANGGYAGAMPASNWPIALPPPSYAASGGGSGGYYPDWMLPGYMEQGG
jgi:hypothetical protein